MRRLGGVARHGARPNGDTTERSERAPDDGIGYRSQVVKAQGAVRSRSARIGPTLVLLFAVAGFVALGPQLRLGAGGAATASDPATLAGEVSGVSAAATFDRSETAPGGTVTVTITIANASSKPIRISVDECGAAATVVGAVKIPIEEDGATWDGVPGKFKSFVFSRGSGPGGAPIAAPASVVGTAVECIDRPEGIDVAINATTKVDLAWKAEIVPGVQAPVGDVPLTITVTFDPAGGPNKDSKDPFAGGPADLQQIVLGGTIRVTGNGKELISAGRAVDAMLGDPDFVKWLGQRPTGTWSTANILLNSNGTGEGIAPKGASWEIDLFREQDGPRTWAIGFVDPFSGTLDNIAYCNDPCDH